MEKTLNLRRPAINNQPMRRFTRDVWVLTWIAFAESVLAVSGTLALLAL